jgi:hypothetical protein
MQPEPTEDTTAELQRRPPITRSPSQHLPLLDSPPTPPAVAPTPPGTRALPGAAVPPADSSAAWLRARPPIHPSPPSPPAAHDAPIPRAPSVRPQTRPPPVRAAAPSPAPTAREERATHAYGRTMAERPASTAEIDASIRRTSAPPPRRGPANEDANTERTKLAPARATGMLALDDEAETHVDMQAISPKFVTKLLGGRGTGDLVADLSLGANRWDAERPLARPPPPELPPAIREIADPTIDEALMGLSPTDEDPGDATVPIDIDELDAPLAGAAWIEPEPSLSGQPAVALPATLPQQPNAWDRARARGQPRERPRTNALTPDEPAESTSDPTLVDLSREALVPTPSPAPTSRDPAPRPARAAPSPTARPAKEAVARKPTANSPSPRDGRPAAPPSIADDPGAIRRVDDASLDDIIQGYLDTKRRR